MPSLKRRRGCPQSTAPGWRATAAGLLVVICIVFLSPAQHVTRNTFAGLAVGVIASVIGNTLTNTWFGEQQPVHPVPQAMTAHRLPTVETGPQPVDRSPVIRPSKPAKKAAPTASVANRSQPDARSPVELPQLLTISDLPRPATVEPPRLLSILGDDLPRLTTGADPPPLTFISDLPRLTTGTDDLPRPIGKPSQLLIYSPDDPPPPATVELPQLLTISDLPRPATVEPPRLLSILGDDLPRLTTGADPPPLTFISDLPRLTTGTDDLPRPIGKPSQLLIYSPDDPPPPATVELPQLLTISDLPRPATVEPPRLLNILSDDLPPATVEPSRLLSILGDDLPRPIGKPSQLLIYSPDDPPPPATVELPQLLTTSRPRVPTRTVLQ